MLFNSYTFIFLFLPIVLAGFYVIGARGYPRISNLWLVVASMFFYAWWNPKYLMLLLASIIFNYLMGVSLSKSGHRGGLFFAVGFNLCLLAYFKYANFFIETIAFLSNEDTVFTNIVLPLAVSFFTFQQIAYLVDSYRGETEKNDFLNYCLFVTFFPQLIAGPIVHHKEMLPQFAKRAWRKFNSKHVSVGLTIFFIGLFKKCILADGIAIYATPVFEAVDQDVAITFFEAWGGALAYTFQLYFDFSGYSDMAIGLGYMFGILLPVNFLSPYKSASIIDFWRRWHMTLSRFLRNYLYIPLGGNRKGPLKRHINIVITMLLGGLWHGAGWTFVAWGGLHGFFLVVNHVWRTINPSVFESSGGLSSIIGKLSAHIITFVAVIVAWVMFRSNSIGGALEFYKGMLGFNGTSFPVQLDHFVFGLQSAFPALDIKAEGLGSFGSPHGVIVLLMLSVIIWFAPNTSELMQQHQTSLDSDNNKLKPTSMWLLRWHPGGLWAIGSAIIAVLMYY